MDSSGPASRLAINLKDDISMETLTFLYTALGIFNEIHYTEGNQWDNYVRWSKLEQLTEVVSLDGMLNRPLVEPDYDNVDDWNFIHTTEQTITRFFTSIEYVLRKCEKRDNFNLLAVVINPRWDCKETFLDEFEFMGYELLDDHFNVSVLTNCRASNGDEPFSPTEVNNYGLIDEYLAAYDIKKRVWDHNPNNEHSKTNVIAVWRHKTIGRGDVEK